MYPRCYGEELGIGMFPSFNLITFKLCNSFSLRSRPSVVTQSQSPWLVTLINVYHLKEEHWCTYQSKNSIPLFALTWVSLQHCTLRLEKIDGVHDQLVSTCCSPVSSNSPLPEEARWSSQGFWPSHLDTQNSQIWIPLGASSRFGRRVHRISWLGSDPQGSSSPTPGLAQDHPQESHHMPELCQVAAVMITLGSFFQHSTSLQVKNLFLIPNLNLPWHNIRPFPQVLSLLSGEKRSVPAPLLPEKL